MISHLIVTTTLAIFVFICLWGNRGTERVNELPRVTQLARSRAGLRCGESGCRGRARSSWAKWLGVGWWPNGKLYPGSQTGGTPFSWGNEGTLECEECVSLKAVGKWASRRMFGKQFWCGRGGMGSAAGLPLPHHPPSGPFWKGSSISVIFFSNYYIYILWIPPF